MRNRVYMAKQFLLAIASVAVLASRPAVAAGTGVVADHAVAELGEFPAEAPPSATFRLTNETSGEIGIRRVRSTCQSCLEITRSGDAIPPNGSVELTARVKPESVHGKFGKTFFVELSGGSPRMIKLEVAGTAIPKVIVSPTPPLQIKDAVPGVRIERVFTLRNRDGGALALGIPRISGILDASCEFLGDAKGDEVKLRLALTPQSGFFRATVRVPVVGNTASPPVSFAMHGMAGSFLTVTPPALPVSPNKPSREFPLRLMLNGQKGAGGELDTSRLTWDRLDGLRLTFDGSTGPVAKGKAVVTEEFARRLATDGPLRVGIRLPDAGTAYLTFLPGRTDDGKSAR